jgi:hypothetical protein
LIESVVAVTHSVFPAGIPKDWSRWRTCTHNQQQRCSTLKVQCSMASQLPGNEGEVGLGTSGNYGMVEHNELIARCVKFQDDFKVQYDGLSQNLGCSCSTARICLQKSLSDGKNRSFFENCTDFHECRQKIGSTWSSISTGAVDRIADVDRVIIAADQNQTAEYEPIMRQMRLRDGSVTETFPELYEAASKARNIFESYVRLFWFRTGTRPHAGLVAPINVLQRQTDTPNDDYSNRDLDLVCLGSLMLSGPVSYAQAKRKF